MLARQPIIVPNRTHELDAFPRQQRGDKAVFRGARRLPRALRQTRQSGRDEHDEQPGNEHAKKGESGLATREQCAGNREQGTVSCRLLPVLPREARPAPRSPRGEVGRAKWGA